MKLGQAIQKFRKQKFPDLLQPEFAEKVGIHTVQLSKIENGKSFPILKNLEKISSALEIPIPLIFMESLEEEDLKPEKRENFRMFHKANIEGIVKALS